MSANRLVRHDVEMIEIEDEELLGGPDGQDVDIIIKLEQWLDDVGV